MKDFGINVKFNYDLEEFLEKVDNFCENSNYGYDVSEKNGEIFIHIELLPYLPIEFKFSDDIILEEKTCYFGSGYHVLVCNFLRELENYLCCEFKVFDETDFYVNKDYAILKEKFEIWMSERVEKIVQNNDNIRIKSILVANQRNYPITKEDYVLTYMGAVSFSEFDKLRTEGIKSVCERFFLFNNEVVDGFNCENYLLYHIWNNLKDLTLVDDFDERMSLVMFMFENLIENNVQIHLPQKYAREIYKYMGVNNFSASNFLFRKVKYDIGYVNYDTIFSDFDVNLLIPGYFNYNSKIDSYVSLDNLISIYEYITDDEVSFENYKLLTDKDAYKIYIQEVKNKGKIFTRIQCEDDDYGYLSVDDYKNIECEESNCKIVDTKNGKFYDISILGTDSTDILESMLKLMV
ncbi:MAG: hypothetical protein PT934_04345 [Peptoniphilaceae bacterium]|uniref:hypothetical protein n=1 Tax=Parvimonas sp. TaxID=1944660 RepID=UPI0025DB4447|nr:hypothetical protein [Parvimonas sp.]MCI5998044.1 hypothetical protein [Parvimonas sp.]MDD7764978.1 hypothetical protein [Peptoniphilaceae bacterium]MDY3050338.1 hypothetical protein [Parvimonas sp.]